MQTCHEVSSKLKIANKICKNAHLLTSWSHYSFFFFRHVLTSKLVDFMTKVVHFKFWPYHNKILVKEFQVGQQNLGKSNRIQIEMTNKCDKTKQILQTEVANKTR